MITHTHTPSDRAVGRRLGLILRTSFFNRERERAYIRAFCARSLFNLPRAVVYQREQRSDIYIYKRSFYKRERYYSLRESDECKEILIYSSRERVSESERERVSERARESFESFFVGGDDGQKISERETNEQRDFLSFRLLRSLCATNAPPK